MNESKQRVPNNQIWESNRLKLNRAAEILFRIYICLFQELF